MSVPVYQFGEFRLDCGKFELLRKGQRLRVERKPMELLILLCSREGQLVTRAEIAQRLWSSEVFVDTEHGINTAIRKLRHLFRDDPENPRFIQTVTGVGYCFIAPMTVERERTAGTTDTSVPMPATPVDNERKTGSLDGDSTGQPTRATHAESDVPGSARRWPRIVAAVGASILLPVLLVNWLDRPEPQFPKISRTVQLTSDGREKMPQIVTDGVRLYFAELKDDRWTLCSLPISGGEATAIPLPFPNVQVMNISPDKSDLLIVEGPAISDGPLWRVPILGGSPRRISNTIGHDGGWSPDGKSFIYMFGNDVYLANGDGGEPRKIDLPQITSNTWGWAPHWSPDGSRIEFSRYVMDQHLASIWEVSARGDHPHLFIPNLQEPPMQCCGAWSRDGSFYLFDVWKKLEGGPPIAPAPDLWAIRRHSTFFHKASDQPIQLTAGPVHFFSHVFSADGKSLFALSTQRREKLSRFDLKSKSFSEFPGLGPAHSISFSRDGWIAYSKFPQGELWRTKSDGSQSLQLTYQPLMVYEPRWSPDGKQIAFYGQEPGLQYGLYLVSAEGGPVRKIRAGTDDFQPTWSVDGSSIYFWSSDDAGATDIEQFNLRTQQVEKVPGSEGLVSAKPSPDGKYISAISADDRRLLLFDVNEKKWSMLLTSVRSHLWSASGKDIYFISHRQPGIYRISINDKKVHEVASLSGVRLSDSIGEVLFLTPQDEPVVREQAELQTEIYALFWDGH